MRRATPPSITPTASRANFYPRSPCGERLPSVLHSSRPLQISIHALLAESDTWARGSRVTYIISIHALLAESDGKSNKLAGRKLVFLSTLSLRRATIIHHKKNKPTRHFYPRSPCGERRSRPQRGPDLPGISIHALLAESDDIHNKQIDKHDDFYPRSPCGERRGSGVGSWPRRIFLSTLSLRRATAETQANQSGHYISIHALLAESDDNKTTQRAG